jgi:hypothetical protein
MSATKVGISVKCVVCFKTKAPRGRSIGFMAHDGYCQDGICSGYWAHPYPGDLWTGETDEDFGYPCSDNATRKL